MILPRPLAPLLLAAALALPGAAATPARLSSATAGSAYILASTANNPGLFGAYFRTRVTVFNPNGGPLFLVFSLLTPNGAGAADATYTLGSGKSVTYANALQDLFGYSGPGAIVVKNDPNAANVGDQFVVSAEVYADDASGKRFSTPVPPMTNMDPVATTTDLFAGSYASGILVDDANRANIGCANADPNVPATVAVALYDAAASQKWTTTLAVPPRGWTQVAVPVAVDRGFASFRTNVYLGYCWAVNVSNSSNDGTLLPATYTVVRPY